MLIGAGCSISAGIPPARGLVDEILKRHATVCDRRFAGRRPSYGEAMSALAPNERRDLIKPYIDNAKINWAHIALAALLKGGEVDTVLTVNFDNLLARACGLLGLYPATYDFGAAPFDRLAGMASPAIIHLHGQGHGMVLMNTEDETRKHAEKVAPVLKRSLEAHPMLVIGYSGEADELFTALQKGYDGGERLYWLTYDDAPPQALRDLMKDHPHITHFGGCDADRVLIEIARACPCWPPRLFENPFEHLLEELAPVADFPLEKDVSGDLLAETRTQLARASRERAKAGGGDAEAAALKGDLGAAADAAKGRADQKLLAALMAAQGYDFFKKYLNASNDADREKWSDKAIALFQQALTFDSARYDALGNWGNLLFDRAKRATDLGEAARLFAAAQAKYAEVLRVKQDDHIALNNWGKLLAARCERAADPQEATRLFDEAQAKYAEALRVKPDKHDALGNWGNLLFDRAKRAADSLEAARLFDAAQAKYAEVLRVKQDDHIALNNWGNLLAARGERAADPQEAARLFDEAQAKYAEALRVKPDNHETHHNWGILLAERGERAADPQEAAQLFDEAQAKFAEALRIKPDDDIALANWGNLLFYLGKRAADPQEAARLIDEAEEKYVEANALKPGRSAYNMACIAAVRGREEDARRLLEAARGADDFPSKQHILADEDFAAYRDTDWFKAFIASLPD